MFAVWPNPIHATCPRHVRREVHNQHKHPCCIIWMPVAIFVFCLSKNSTFGSTVCKTISGRALGVDVVSTAAVEVWVDSPFGDDGKWGENGCSIHLEEEPQASVHGGSGETERRSGENCSCIGVKSHCLKFWSLLFSPRISLSAILWRVYRKEVWPPPSPAPQQFSWETSCPPLPSCGPVPAPKTCEAWRLPSADAVSPVPPLPAWGPLQADSCPSLSNSTFDSSSTFFNAFLHLVHFLKSSEFHTLISSMVMVSTELMQTNQYLILHR